MMGGGGGGGGGTLSPSDMGHSAKAMREEQLGKVRDNLLVSHRMYSLSIEGFLSI